MVKLVLLGTGNLATHLFYAFQAVNDISVIQMVGRNLEKLKPFGDFVEIATDYNNVKDADIYIIAVKDDAIEHVASRISDKQGLVVHTSGATDVKVIATKNRGVFYPLQTFSRGRTINFENVPIGIETENASSYELLKQIATSISNSVLQINSEYRKNLHLAAVFANNFTNHLYQIAAEICETNGLSFDLMKPLILETAKKVQTFPPFLAQTGPAKRGDNASMEAHLEQLKNTSHMALYKELSKSIQAAYEKEL